MTTPLIIQETILDTSARPLNGIVPHEVLRSSENHFREKDIE